MSLSALDDLARRYGIALVHKGIDGTEFRISKATKQRVLAALGVKAETAAMVAESRRAAKKMEPAVLKAAEGKKCFLPEWLRNGRAWGITVQLYELRSQRNWGIGDFADLAVLCVVAAKAGADFLGTNPLHALFLAEPKRCSPFSPSSRLFLNPLYIAVDRVPGYTEAFAEPHLIRQLVDAPLVDYDGVATAKLKALRKLWELRKGSGGDAATAADDFEEFRKKGGKALRLHALFEALSFHMVEEGRGAGWATWPEEYHDPKSKAVAAFARQNEDEIAFHIWLQWLAAMQLDAAKAAAKAAGMRIGLYLDLAVGEAPDGSARWSERDLFVPGVSVGAPPDFFTANGQDWGLSPLSPRALAENGCVPYRRMLDASMRYAGALRIDHAMSLWQIFFVPEGGTPSDGAYVRYPIEQLLATLADLSVEHEAIVIGEDLGNVPEGFREVMEEAGMLSYRILYFEQKNGGFTSPQDYPRLALACLSTHDLPTLRGWWRGDDIRLRKEHGLIDADAAAAQSSERAALRNSLIRTLLACKALKVQELMPAREASPTSRSAVPTSLVVAAHRFIAKTPSVLMGVRLADLTGESRPTNLPGTVDSYPNWRPKCPVPVEELAGFPLFRAITRAISEERPKML
jgi:4-alpha-glucanotransferase